MTYAAWLPSDDDRILIQELLDERKRQSLNAPLEKEQDRPSSSPEVYVCKPPPNGIPPLTIRMPYYPDIPGQADCDIYRIDINISTGDPELIEVSNVSRTVYNVSLSWIDTPYKIINRDKFGKWVAEFTGGGDTTGTGTPLTGTGTTPPLTGTGTSFPTGTGTSFPTGTGTSFPTGTGTGTSIPCTAFPFETSGGEAVYALGLDANGCLTVIALQQCPSDDTGTGSGSA